MNLAVFTMAVLLYIRIIYRTLEDVYSCVEIATNVMLCDGHVI